MAPDPSFGTAGGLRPGSRFAGYVIERELGRGGAGVVFMARDEQLQRSVALKVLHDVGLADDAAAQERFRNEALLAARLEHPAIVPLYNAGTERGLTYLAMRHVSGRSLAQILDADGALPPADTLRLLRPIAEALDYAADSGIVHRDVKPGNILVDETVEPPRAYLSDFGIARAFEGTRHTATGSWVGTPEYIAPEVFKDETPTGAADQYALACVLVEALTGTSPFKRTNTAATIAAHVSETPDLTPLERLGSGTVDVIEMALSKNPADRFTSSTELIDALQQTIRADSKATPQTVVRKRRRHRRLRRSVAILVPLAGAIGFAIGAADYFGFHPFGIGAGAARQANATAVVVDAEGPPLPDVLVLGTEIIEPKGNWGEGGAPTLVLPDGVNAAMMFTDLLKRVPGTSNLTTETVPLTDSEACGTDLQRLSAGGATRAIIVLESACYASALQGISDLGTDAPPTYVAGLGFTSGVYLPSRVAFASPRMREDQHKVTPDALSPETISGYLDTLPDPIDDSPIVFPMVSNAEGLGSMIAFAQAQRGEGSAPYCERLAVLHGEADFGHPDFAKINASAGTQINLIRNGYADALDITSIPLDRNRLTGSSAGSDSPDLITGRAGLDALLRDQLRRRGTCLYVPGVVGPGMEGRISWLAELVKQVRQWSASVPVIIEGNPNSIADPQLDVTPDLENVWAQTIAQRGVWLAETFTKSSPESPVAEVFVDLLQSRDVQVNFGSGPELTYWEIVPKIVAMINAQSECIPETPGCFGRRNPGQRFESLEPGEWSGAIDAEIDQWARVDPYSRSVTADAVFWWGSGGRSSSFNAGNQYYSLLPE